MLIETDRLVITEFEESMIENVHKNSLDNDSRKFIPDEVFETVEQARETVCFLIDCYKGNQGPFVYPVLLKSGENVGYVQAVPLNNGWEIGYHIAQKYTRNGYATEALRVFIPVIMEQLNISSIWGICRGDNIASRCVLEKNAFVLQKKSVTDYKGEQHEVCKYLYTIV